MDPVERLREELVKQANTANKIDRERAELMTGLVASPGWKAYVEVLNALIQNAADELTAPAGSVDKAVALEYVKGTFGGLVKARDLPSVIIGAMPPLNPDDEGREDA